MFDLPVTGKDERREYERFRKALIAQGFMMMQFSVYMRFCASRANCKKYIREIRRILPRDGQVRVLSITDKQFEDMLVYYGRKPVKSESKPEQLLLF